MSVGFGLLKNLEGFFAFDLGLQNHFLQQREVFRVVSLQSFVPKCPVSQNVSYFLNSIYNADHRALMERFTLFQGPKISSSEPVQKDMLCAKWFYEWISFIK